MGEYVSYQGEQIKIGTCECLYYVSYNKFLAFDRNWYGTFQRTHIPIYLQTEQGFLFRFPFPDEDKLRFGDIIQPYDRTINIALDEAARVKLGIIGTTGLQEIGISMQKPEIDQDGKFCLSLFFKDLKTGIGYTTDNVSEVKIIARQIVKHHISNETAPEKKEFYRQIACRILKGYNLEYLATQRQHLQTKTDVPDNIATQQKSDQQYSETQNSKTINKTDGNSAQRPRKKGRKI